MSIQTFSLGTIIGVMDGLIVAEFDRLVDQAREDCRNRAAVDKPRKVTLEITLTPTDPDNPHLMHVGFTTKSAIPRADVGAYIMCSKPHGLSYSTESPANPDQTSMDDHIPSRN